MVRRNSCWYCTLERSNTTLRFVRTKWSNVSVVPHILRIAPSTVALSDGKKQLQFMQLKSVKIFSSASVSLDVLNGEYGDGCDKTEAPQSEVYVQ